MITMSDHCGCNDASDTCSVVIHSDDSDHGSLRLSHLLRTHYVVVESRRAHAITIPHQMSYPPVRVHVHRVGASGHAGE